MKRFLTIKITLAVILMIIICSCKKDSAKISGNGTYNGHDYIDLGLPSGTLWATCNIGASKPEELGDKFAWGETTPKAEFSWNNYKYCKNGDKHQLTKYCYESYYGYNGYTDNLTVLQASDDAAIANWGNGWRMPTKDEWKELEEKTIHEWTTQNGVRGTIYVGDNGEKIFIPHIEEAYLELIGYWTINLYTHNREPYLAHASINCRYPQDRFNGYPIRPVRATK